MIKIVKKKSKLPKDQTGKASKPLVRKDYIVAWEHLEDFKDWLDNAFPNEKFCYHTGPYVSGKKIAVLVAKAYEKGLITMYQRKTETPSIYEYWAIKTGGYY